MLRHRLTLLTLDLFLIGISYLLIIWFKDNPGSYLTQKYLFGLAFFSVIWITVSVSFKKYFPKHPPWESSTAHIIVINLLIFGIIVIIMYGARSLEYSRMVIFGTIGILTILEVIVNKIYRLVIQNGNGTTASPGRKSKEKHLPPAEARIKADHDIRIRNISLSENQLKKDIIEECGENAYDFITKNIDLLEPKNLVVSTSTRFNILYQPDGYLTGIINLKRINDTRYLNKFFETVNEKIPSEGKFIGCAETKNLRKQRLLRKFPSGLNWIYYFFDYIIKRVLPKFNLTRNIYFLLTRGENRVLTRAEILGRLYSCGFVVQNEQFTNGKYFFCMKKTGDPVYPENPTYGALIRFIYKKFKGKFF